MRSQLEKSWWVPLVRGLATVLLGVIALVRPHAEPLVLTFVVFALVDGIAGVVGSVMNRKEDGRWWLAVARGLFGIAPGVLVLVLPQLDPLRLLHILAVRTLLTGILDIITAIRLRKEIEGGWLLILGGLAAVLFGVIAFAIPGAGAQAVVWLIAIYAFFVGGILMILAFRMRGWGKKPEKLGAR
jgi:uncharacterized membrane protein HdeD (DUF308 family)